MKISIIGAGAMGGAMAEGLIKGDYIKNDDVILIVDDFLANGEALNALINIVSQAGSELVGCGIVIEKAYQPGGELIRSKGIRVESLARIKSMSVENGIEFCE